MSERRNLLQESLAAIERLQDRLDASERARHEPIAIVGAGCRYPGGVETPEDLWRLVRAGVNAVGEVPADRWDADAYYDPDPKAPGKMITRRGGFLNRVDGFDAQFFGISPREAATMDPQQRLLLETATEALESAGIATDRLAGSATGVFVGITTSDYGQLLRAGGPENSDVYSATGAALNAAAGRISFTYGFQGPCVALDTACSSSLVAVHLACQSLRAGESDLALAGGVNVVLSPDAMVLFSKWGMMAPDGACKTFDAAADGFVRAEGCAMVALKRLADAQAAGDPILAVIRGSAVNSDGRSSGLTVPNGPAQQAVVRKALADARVEAADLDYVEAHGTGTPLGDPIEIEALGAAMGAGRTAQRPLLVGSIKTNLGHTEAASGLAGLLKVVMSLRHECIPPHLHFSTPNPRIPWAELPIKVPTDAVSWPRGARIRRAGVSSFGFSGTNAHVIVEEAPAPALPLPPVEDAPRLLVLSARGEAALRAVAQRHGDYLASHPDASLAHTAATLAAGRAHLDKRAALVADTALDAANALRTFARGELPLGLVTGSARLGERPKVAFLFTGQGAQYVGMGRELYHAEPVFRAALDRCASILANHLERPLLDVIFAKDTADAAISETAYTQPGLFALEYSLCELWRSWGITPSIVAGHSVGEYVAACVAGVFTLEDGLALIAARGRLMQALPPGGAMAAVFADEPRVAGRIAGYGDRVAIAAVNGPEEIVITGDADAVAEIIAGCTADAIKTRALNVSHAFHSARLEPMLDEFERRAAAVNFAAPRIPLVSNLTGKVFAPGELPDARYWRRHARGTVRFLSCIDSLRTFGANTLLEIGPHPTLVALAARARPDATWATAASLRQGRAEQREMLASLGLLYTRGAAIKWDALAGSGRRMPLPTYPFQRDRHWVEPAKVARRQAATDGHPLLGTRQRTPSPGVQFLAEVSADQPAWLAEHVIFGHTLVPGTAYVEMALAAARQSGYDGAIAIREIVIEAPLRLDGDQATLLHVELPPADTDGAPFVIRSLAPAQDDEQWRTHAKGVLYRDAAAATSAPSMPAIADLRDRCASALDVTQYYAALERMGLAYGPAFRALRDLRIGDDEAIGLLELASPDDRVRWNLHPALLDAAFHVLGGILRRQAGGEDDRVYVPIGIDEVHVAAPIPRQVWVAGRVRAAGADRSVRVADLRLEDGAGQFLASVSGLRLRQVTAESLARAVSAPTIAAHAYALRWQPAVVPAVAMDPKGRRYLVVGDAAGFASAIAQALRDQGASCSVISGDHDWRNDAAAADWIIDCAAIDHPPASRDLWPSIRHRYSHLLNVAQRLASAESQAGLCVVTRGAQPIAAGDEVDLTQSVLLGLARTVAAEHAEAPMARIDLDPSAPLDPAMVLKALGAAPGGECEIGIRNGEALAPRLDEMATAATQQGEGERTVLRIRERGSLDGLHLESEARRAPAAGEVEIAVHAAGLNFRDVLNTLGMYPGDAGPLGSECSGVVVAVGDNVNHLRAGDAVVGFAIDSMASHVTTNAAIVVRKPEPMTFCDAVTVPNAYLTAAYSFHVAGGLKAGQRVLIHAAAGGVGMAALRLARRAGVEVIATAGSERKRALALDAGAAHAFDSRSTTFADDVLRVTGGAGVDLVLNSLAGDFIAAGMRCVAHGGSFVEIGKGGIWTDAEAAQRAPGVRYSVVDLGLAIRDDAASIRDMLEQVLDDVARGALAPLPVQAFSLTQAQSAFRYMAAARHVGKIALVPEQPAGQLPMHPHGAATYLITGGVGGLGLATAEWLATRGAKELVLVGRRSPAPADDAKIARMRESGTGVTVVACDVGDRESVRALWRDVLSSRPPLKGIVHAAGVLADAPLAQQDAAAFDAVAHAKISGAWHLHEMTAHTALDFFVLYSSASARFGSAGQANYAAANSFLDGLADYRRSRGQCATSLAWGAWSQVGMAARMSDATRARWARSGIGFLSPDDAFAAVERALTTTQPYVAIVAIDPRKAVAQATPSVRALFGRHGSAAAANEGTRSSPVAAAADEPTLQARLLAAASNRRRTVLRDHVRQAVARVLGLARADQLSVDEPLGQLGLDSLMSVELRNTLGKAAGRTLPATITFEYPSVIALTDYLATTVFVSELAASGDAAPAPAVVESAATSVEDDLSADELAAELLSRLDGMNIQENS